MRIVAGAWRGRVLRGPVGGATRPTAERVRQALFDMVMHAAWGGRGLLEGVTVLDAFAGTGALGLEAVSRGAARAVFIERDREALEVLRLNIAACRAEAVCTVIPGDATRPLRAGVSCGLVFLDPPYAQGLITRALAALSGGGWLAPGAIVVGELGAEEDVPMPGTLLASRTHGAAQIAVWRMSGDSQERPSRSD